MSAELDHASARGLVEGIWEDSILPELTEYIRIPAKSPHFDADWAANGTSMPRWPRPSVGAGSSPSTA
ncbi:MAG: hypothetical protein U5L11_11080 [Arhodomonas sp.]|nr:hypothetical protein [Arhodomonas sp.]